MRTTRMLLIATVAALMAVSLPVVADDAVPEACMGAPALGPDEVLVEQTAYFTTPGRVGNLDANDSAYAAGTTDEQPQGDESKVMLSRPGTIGNPAVQQNWINGFFVHDLGTPSRVVCAQIDIYVASPNGQLPIQFFVDGAEFAGAVSGSAGAGNLYSGKVRRLDAVGWDITVQFNAGAPGAAVLYDSADHPSSLTVVTVEKA